MTEIVSQLKTEMLNSVPSSLLSLAVGSIGGFCLIFLNSACPNHKLFFPNNDRRHGKASIPGPVVLVYALDEKGKKLTVRRRAL